MFIMVFEEISNPMGDEVYLFVVLGAW